jgi:hypothetical protein
MVPDFVGLTAEISDRYRENDYEKHNKREPR